MNLLAGGRTTGTQRLRLALILAAIVAVLSLALTAPAFAAEPPTVTKVEPRFGPASGGTSVTITGTNFTGVTAVRFDSTNAKSFTVNSETSITAVSPAGTGTVDVTVTNPSGTSATSEADRFSYVPTVSKLDPNHGLPGGGSTVTITGIGFTGVTAVHFGATSAKSFTVTSETSITAVSPAGTGTVDVTVTNPSGTSATSEADRFTFAETFKCTEGGTCPRILQNGTEAKLENGKLLPVLAWGTLTIEQGKLGLIKCKYAFGGVATDPGVAGAGDLPGEAKMQGFSAYNCTDGACELAGQPVEVTPLGQASNPVTKTKETVGRITTPWGGVVNEPKEKEWRLKIGNKAKTESQIRFSIVCPAQAVSPEFTGELNVPGEGGTLIGAAPAKLEFKGVESGELESSVGGAGFTGKAKLAGYEAQEVITVVNQ